MYEIAAVGGFIAVSGLLAAIFAKPLGTWNERVVEGMPAPVKRFYRMLGAGAPYDSAPWVAYHRVAGLLLLLFGILLAVLALAHP